MRNVTWVSLLKAIPTEEYPNLMLMTCSGTEIAIQNVLRIDHEFLALKGRISGTQDDGRVFFVPFGQIDYCGFQKPVKEADFQEMFGTLVMPASHQDASVSRERNGKVPVETSGQVPGAPSSPSPVAPSTAANGQGAGTAGDSQRSPIKSAILERFRSRSPSNPGTKPSTEEG